MLCPEHFNCISVLYLELNFLQEEVRPLKAPEGRQDRWLSAHDRPGHQLIGSSRLNAKLKYLGSYQELLTFHNS